MTNITQDNLYLILPSKVSWLAGMLSEDTGASVVEAIRRIYNSDFYRKLEVEETKLWYEGPVALYAEMSQEKNSQLEIGCSAKRLCKYSKKHSNEK